VLQAVFLGRAARNSASLKNRQPLSILYIQGGAELSEGYKKIIEGELNVKEVRFVTDARAYTTYIVKPQLRTVGPKYGKLVDAIGKYLAQADGNEVVDSLDAKGTFDFALDGTQVSLTRDDLLLEKTQKPGFVAQTERAMTVILDTNLTPALIDEGYAREVVSKIQTMRKEAGFDVTDKITVCLSADKKLSDAVEAVREGIMDDVMADGLLLGETDPQGYVKEWDINGIPAQISVRRIYG